MEGAIIGATLNFEKGGRKVMLKLKKKSLFFYNSSHTHVCGNLKELPQRDCSFLKYPHWHSITTFKRDLQCRPFTAIFGVHMNGLCYKRYVLERDNFTKGITGK